MKRKNWKRILAISLLAVMVLTVVASAPQVAKAGFGDFDSFSDYGGSRKRGSSSDSDGFDLYALLRIATLFGRIFGIESPYVSIILALVVVFGVKYGVAALKGRSGSSTEHEGADYSSEYKPESLKQLRSEDPSFDSADLIQRIKALFEKMQICWENGNIEPLRKDFMPDTWTRFNTQLQNKKAAGETSHVRNILFEQVVLQSYSTDSEHQVLKVKIDVTHNIWTTNRRGKCIQGTEKTRKRFEFIWTMMRPLGSRTGGSAVADTMHCPNCGAEVDLEAFAECPFCHTPIMKVSQDWVISEIDALSQRTLHE